MRPDSLCCTQTIKNGNYHGWKAFSFAASQGKKGFLRAGWEMTSSMLYLYCSEQAGLLLSNAFALQASSCTMKFDIFHFFLLGYISHVWSVLSPIKINAALVQKKMFLVELFAPRDQRVWGWWQSWAEVSIGWFVGFRRKTFASNSCRLALIHDVLFVVQQTEEKKLSSFSLVSSTRNLYQPLFWRAQLWDSSF